MRAKQLQRRSCGAADEHRRLLNEDNLYAANRALIESLTWEVQEGQLNLARRGVTRIPVVVHVVSNAAANNISDAQIQTQIDVLNRDFRRTNTDIGQVPSAWQNLVADARIEFELATSDPQGNSTNGIVRVTTQQSIFHQPTNDIKSAATGGSDPWPSNLYLNIWVGPRIVDVQNRDLLGYAQFPGGPAATDGVVILHSAFGTSGSAQAPFNLGRTATHEIGHWLNLFHIWGDDGNACYGSDQINDTPNAGGPNFGTPTFPHVTCNNGPNGDMFVNYMDYVDDASMFMFTQEQVTRMQTALDGPRSEIGSSVLIPFTPFTLFTPLTNFTNFTKYTWLTRFSQFTFLTPFTEFTWFTRFTGDPPPFDVDPLIQVGDTVFALSELEIAGTEGFEDAMEPLAAIGITYLHEIVAADSKALAKAMDGRVKDVKALQSDARNALASLSSSKA